MTTSADSVEGIVRVVGVDALPQVVLATDDAQSIRLVDAGRLDRVAGLRVLVRGVRDDRQMKVKSFRVVAANGVPATDGKLSANGTELLIITEDGRRLTVRRPAAGLRAIVGHRVWLAGPLDGETVAYGVIE